MFSTVVQLTEGHTITASGPDETRITWSCSCGASGEDDTAETVADHTR